MIILFIILFPIAVMIFIQSIREIQNEIGKDLYEDIRKWYRGTRFFMWYNNYKNGVKILSEKEYDMIMRGREIRNIVIEVED